MSGIDFVSVKRILGNHMNTSRIAEMKLQSAGVEEFKIQETDLPVFSNILASEAYELLKISKPTSIAIKYADTVNVTYWWNLLKDSFAKDIKNVSFLLINLGDQWKPKLGSVPIVLSEVIEKMTAMKPGVFHIYCSETSFTFTSLKGDFVEDGYEVAQSFSMKLCGTWNLRTTYGSLLSTALKPHLPNIKKLYLVCHFPCLTCTDRLFEGLDWPLPSSSGLENDPKVFWRTWEATDLYFDVNMNARRMAKYHKFMLPTSGTKVHCFYGERKSVEWTKKNQRDYSTQMLC